MIDKIGKFKRNQSFRFEKKTLRRDETNAVKLTFGQIFFYDVHLERLS